MMSISNLLISNAYAEGAAASTEPSFISQAIIFVPLILIFYFLILRPQQKRAKEIKVMLEALQKGDEVVTTGGVMGRVAKIGEGFISVEVAEGVNLNIQRAAIQTVLPKGTIKSIN